MLAARSSSALQVRFLVARALISCRAYSKDYASSSDDEKDTGSSKTPKTKKAPAINEQVSAESKGHVEESTTERLNRLLSSMQTVSNTFEHKISMAKPGETNRKNKEKVKQAASEKDIFVAAKRVATLLGEVDTKKTESELLSKLLGHNIDEVPTTNKDGEPKEKSAGNANELSLSELIVGMKIDRSQPSKKPDTRADFVRHSLAAKGQNKRTEDRQNARGGRPQREYQRAPESYTGSVNLFGGEPMGIFKNIEHFKPSDDILPTWAHLHQRELQLQVLRPPANYFDKVAMWTQQGKVWRFPIDNEQDMSEDIASEDFSDHIFLEQHLESWCPNKGPIRHFMELVCVGLSKNPYITAKEKKEHILWYRDYFEAKKDILKDLMSQDKIEQAMLSNTKTDAI